MKIEIERNELLKGLTLIQGVVEKKKTLPILLNVLLETEQNKLILTATDLEIGIKSKYNANILENGRITVNAKKIFEIIKELPEEIIILQTKENNWIEIKCKNSKFNILALSPEEFPTISSVKYEEKIEVSNKIVNTMIDKTFTSISTDETKYNLSGLFIHKTENNKLRAVSTDGHRLSLYESDEDLINSKILDKGVIIPRKGIIELKKITENIDENIEISIVDNNLIINNSEILLIIRLIDGDFPDYTRVIPENVENFAVVDTNILLQSLKRIAILASEKSRGINLLFTDGKLEMTSSNPEFGNASDYIDIKYSGVDINIGFNVKYLIDVLYNINSEKINFYINDNTSPCLITQDNNKKYQAVIMPMRL